MKIPTLSYNLLTAAPSSTTVVITATPNSSRSHFLRSFALFAVISTLVASFGSCIFVYFSLGGAGRCGFWLEIKKNKDILNVNDFLNLDWTKMVTCVYSWRCSGPNELDIFFSPRTTSYGRRLSGIRLWDVVFLSFFAWRLVILLEFIWLFRGGGGTCDLNKIIKHPDSTKLLFTFTLWERTSSVYFGLVFNVAPTSASSSELHKEIKDSNRKILINKNKFFPGAI